MPQLNNASRSVRDPARFPTQSKVSSTPNLLRRCDVMTSTRSVVLHPRPTAATEHATQKCQRRSCCRSEGSRSRAPSSVGWQLPACYARRERLGRCSSPCGPPVGGHAMGDDTTLPTAPGSEAVREQMFSGLPPKARPAPRECCHRGLARWLITSCGCGILVMAEGERYCQHARPRWQHSRGAGRAFGGKPENICSRPPRWRV